MDALVEVHDDREFERAVGLGARVIGVNARDLQTMEIDTDRQHRLIASLPSTVVRVAESGIESRARSRGRSRRRRRRGAGRHRPDARSGIAPRARRGAATVSVLVKICGLTRPEDVDAAVDAGADLVGFVLEASSPRSVSPSGLRELAARVPEGVRTVAVVVSGDGPEPAITDLVQTYEPAGALDRHDRGHRVARRPPACPPESRCCSTWPSDLRPDKATLEAHWQRAARTPGRVMLAGSLTPENVAAAVAIARPWAVDTARGVESEPGVKDHDLIRRFVTATPRRQRHELDHARRAAAGSASSAAGSCPRR